MGRRAAREHEKTTRRRTDVAEKNAKNVQKKKSCVYCDGGGQAVITWLPPIAARCGYSMDLQPYSMSLADIVQAWEHGTARRGRSVFFL